MLEFCQERLVSGARRGAAARGSGHNKCAARGTHAVHTHPNEYEFIISQVNNDLPTVRCVERPHTKHVVLQLLPRHISAR